MPIILHKRTTFLCCSIVPIVNALQLDSKNLRTNERNGPQGTDTLAVGLYSGVHVQASQSATALCEYVSVCESVCVCVIDSAITGSFNEWMARLLNF
jgi:hypothetical protein